MPMCSSRGISLFFQNYHHVVHDVTCLEVSTAKLNCFLLNKSCLAREQSKFHLPMEQQKIDILEQQDESVR